MMPSERDWEIINKMRMRLSSEPNDVLLYVPEKRFGFWLITLFIDVGLLTHHIGKGVFEVRRRPLRTDSQKKEERKDIEAPKLQPPKGARLLASYMPKKHREFLIGDLDEQFEYILKEFGEKAARRRYWLGVIFSLWPLVLREAEKVATIIGKLKIK